MSYTEDYFSKLTPGQWYFIKDLPGEIGFPGLINAFREQILSPDFEIIIGRFFSTYKVVRTRSESMPVIETIGKAV